MKKYIFSLICILAGCVLTGCAINSSIDFKRESAGEHIFKDIQAQTETQKTKVTKSKSGMVIYKDNTTLDTTGDYKNFIGPKNIDFDLNFKF